MGIALNVSNHLEPLAKQLGLDFQASEKTAFSKCYIVTQTDGMNAWLKYRLAEQHGIAANIEFLKPNDLIGLLYTWVKGYHKPLMSIEMLQWAIYSILDHPNINKQFPSIAEYYLNQPVKQMALATKLADLFDQYQMYRQDLLRAWEQSVVANEDEAFQAYLWLSIHQKYESALTDKSGAIKTIIEALSQSTHSEYIQSMLKDVYFFGMAVITPQHLHLFHELSKLVDLKFYLLNPAPEYYWWEDRSEKDIVRMTQKFKRDTSKMNFGILGNDILNNWGKVIKETFYTLFQDETYINVYNDDLALIPKAPQTLLEKLQSDVYHNAVKPNRQIILESDLHDQSLVVNACYTPYREVESLYNYFVKLVDDGQITAAREVVVMVSDIDAYAPYIKAVFNHAPYKFPFTIADEKMQNEHSLFASISALMAFEWDDFKAESMMQLIEQPYIQQRFQFTDLEQIRAMIQTANIRFGVEAKASDGSYVHSWSYGLDRLFYGLMISGEPEINVNGLPLIPLDAYEGQAQETVVKLYSFYKQLKKSLAMRHAPRHVDAWCDWLLLLVEDILFQANEAEDEAYHHLLKIVERLRKVNEFESIQVPFEVFRFHFLKFLEYETKQKSFAGTGITFCSLIPMRSIPFKVVAMLGLNFDQFPRKEQHPSFNLMELHKRKGDRNIKDNDKHLFLETLLSAQSRLYLSYVGYSVKDGSKLPPSSLIDELLEYILQGCASYQPDWLNALVIEQPLHHFSEQYGKHSKLYNYINPFSNSKPFSVLLEEANAPTKTIDRVVFSDFKLFFTDSIKWYFNKVLLINYNEDELLLPDHERFELDNLEAWQLRRDLMQLQPEDRAAYFHKKQLQGELPLLQTGQMAFKKVADDLDDLLEPISEIIKGKHKQFLCPEYSINQFRLKADIEVYDDYYVHLNSSSAWQSKILGAFLDYLLLRSAGYDLHFLYADKKSKVVQLPVTAMSQAKARDLLNLYWSIFEQNQTQPYMLLWAYFKLLYKKQSDDASKLIKSIESNVLSPDTFTDVYFQKIWDMNWLTTDNIHSIVDQMALVFEPVNLTLNLLTNDDN
jgi:exodeoxyribonuclease V gamma subunit